MLQVVKVPRVLIDVVEVKTIVLKSLVENPTNIDFNLLKSESEILAANPLFLANEAKIPNWAVDHVVTPPSTDLHSTNTSCVIVDNWSVVKPVTAEPISVRDVQVYVVVALWVAPLETKYCDTNTVLKLFTKVS